MTRLLGGRPAHTRRALRGALALCAAITLAACGGSDPAPAPPAAWSLQPVSDAALVARWQTALNADNSAQSLVLSTDALSPPVNGSAVGAKSGVSGTVLQESAVDEADLIKSDGVSVFSVWPGTDGQPGSDPTAIERHALSDDAAAPALQARERLVSPLRNAATVQGLFLDTERAQLVALGERGSHAPAAERWFKPLQWLGGGTELAVLNTADTLSTRYTLSLSAQLVGSRRIGSTLYLVLRSRAQPEGFDATWAAASNTQKLAELKAADVLPTVSLNGGAAQPLLAPDSCLAAVKPAEASADVITLLALDLASSAPQWSASCFAGSTETFYLSPDKLYLATSRWRYTQGSSADQVVYPGDMATDIHQFALDGGGFSYQGSGTVRGHLGFDMNRKPWRLSEHQGVLRVATETAQRWAWGPVMALPVDGTTTTNATAASDSDNSPVRLTLLKPDASKALAVVGTLPNAQRPAPLGKPGEQLYASRFVGDRAYLVTYRLTDPLYVLDLSDPTDPRTLGELEISGYSDYLFPLSARYLLGIGKDAASDGSAGDDGRLAWYQGVKVSLIDVADPTQPTEVAKTVIGQRGTQATVLQDHHGVALLPVTPSTGASASVVRVALPVKLHDMAPTNGDTSASTYYSFTRTQLSRLEVDLDSGTLKHLPALSSADSGTERDIGNDRALLSRSQAHHYQNGRWASWAWE